MSYLPNKRIYSIIFLYLASPLYIVVPFCPVDFIKSLAKYRNESIHIRDKTDDKRFVGWSTWSAWGPCVGECSNLGYQIRNRTCIKMISTNYGVPCKGDSHDLRSCHLTGTVSCSLEKFESIFKNDPLKYNEYKLIKRFHKHFPELTKRCLTYQCNFDTVYKFLKQKSVRYWSALLCVKYGTGCPVYGDWNEWSLWSECTAKYGEGMRFRYRQCNRPQPSGDQYYCLGEKYTAEKCTGNDLQSAQGIWSSWSDWSPCSKTCGFGIMRKYRICKKLNRHERGLQYNLENMIKLININKIFNNTAFAFKSIGSNKTFNNNLNNLAKMDTLNNSDYISLFNEPINCVETIDKHKPATLSTKYETSIKNNYSSTNSKNTVQNMLMYNFKEIVGKIRLGNKETTTKNVTNEISSLLVNSTTISPHGYRSTLPIKQITNVNDSKTFSSNINKDSIISNHCSFNQSSTKAIRITPINTNHKDKISLSETKGIICNVSSLSKIRDGDNVLCSTNTKSYTKMSTNFNITCLNLKREILKPTTKSFNVNKFSIASKHGCIGPFEVFRICRVRNCPVDGGWSDWSSWSMCSAYCGQGIQTRLRSCSNPYSQHGGKPCNGNTSMVKNCANYPCEVLLGHDHYIFSGTSYAKFNMIGRQNLLLHVYLKFKTVSVEGELIYGYDTLRLNKNSNFYLLSLTDGKLSFTALLNDCKSSLISFNQLSVNEWHELLLTITGDTVKMRIDDNEINTATFTCRPTLEILKYSLFVGKRFRGFIQQLIINFVQFQFHEKTDNDILNVVYPIEIHSIDHGPPDIEDSFVSLNQLIRAPCPQNDSHWVIKLALLPETTIGQLLYMKGKRPTDFITVILEVNRIKLIMSANNTAGEVENSEEIIPNKWLYIVINKSVDGTVSLKVNSARKHKIVSTSGGYTNMNFSCESNILIGYMPFKLKINMVRENPGVFPITSVVGKLGLLKIDDNLFDLPKLHPNQMHLEMFSNLAISSADFYEEKVMIAGDVVNLTCIYNRNMSQFGGYLKNHTLSILWSQLNTPIPLRSNLSDYIVKDNKNKTHLQFSSFTNRQVVEGFYSCWIFDSNERRRRNRITYGLIFIDVDEDYRLPLMYKLIIFKAFLTAIYLLVWCIYHLIINFFKGDGYWKSRKLDKREQTKRMERIILSYEGRFYLGSELAVTTALDRLNDFYECDNSSGWNDSERFAPGFEQGFNVNYKFTENNSLPVFYFGSPDANISNNKLVKQENIGNGTVNQTVNTSLNEIKPVEFESDSNQCDWKNIGEGEDVNSGTRNTSLSQSSNESNGGRLDFSNIKLKFPLSSNVNLRVHMEMMSKLKSGVAQLSNNGYLCAEKNECIYKDMINKGNCPNWVFEKNLPSGPNDKLQKRVTFSDSLTKFYSNNQNVSGIKIIKTKPSYHYEIGGEAPNKDCQLHPIQKTYKSVLLDNEGSFNKNSWVQNSSREEVHEPDFCPDQNTFETEESPADRNTLSLRSLLNNTRLNSLRRYKVVNKKNHRQMLSSSGNGKSWTRKVRKQMPPKYCEEDNEYVVTGKLNVRGVDLLNRSIMMGQNDHTVLEESEIREFKHDNLFEQEMYAKRLDSQIPNKVNRININDSFCKTLIEAKQNLRPGPFSLEQTSTIFNKLPATKYNVHVVTEENDDENLVSNNNISTKINE